MKFHHIKMFHERAAINECFPLGLIVNLLGDYLIDILWSFFLQYFVDAVSTAQCIIRTREYFGALQIMVSGEECQ